MWKKEVFQGEAKEEFRKLMNPLKDASERLETEF